MPEAAWSDAHRGQRAVERMLEYAPSTGGLALWVRHEDLAADDPRAAGDAPPMATDGETLWYAPSFARLPLAEQTGWVARGVLHVAFGHAQRLADLRARLGDVDARLFAACADAIVDASLAPHGWLAPPRGAVRLETLLKASLGIETDVDRALREWDVERLYRAIDDRRPSPSGRDGRGGGRGSGKGDGDGTDRGDGRGTAGAQGSGGADRPAPQAASSAADAGSLRDRTANRANGAAAPSAIAAIASADAAAPSADAKPDARSGDRSDGARADPSTGAARIDGPRAARARALCGDRPSDLLDPVGAGSPEVRAERERDWAERLARAHAGDGDFSMLRTLDALRTGTRTPWEQLLRARLCRALSRRPAESWSRPSRGWLANAGRGAGGARMPWEPGRASSSAVPRLAVLVDVSGSIDDATMERFSREIDAIARRQEAALTVVVGDDRVRRVEVFEAGRPGLSSMRFQGGGGTDFAPLLREADRHRPDIAVVLTDLDGPAAYRPAWPVIWAVPEGVRSASAPFGRIVTIA